MASSGAEDATMGESGDAIFAHVEEAEEPFLNTSIILNMDAGDPPPLSF